ncbi:MAG TPA: cytochrome c3 family protein [Bacteroidales bacterium]|nr:cytochrome c3 family protein [Bacteroidales bacterium]
MVYKANVRPAWVVLVLLMVFTLAYALVNTSETPIRKTLQSTQDSTAKFDLTRFKNAQENEQCLKCHGQPKYTYKNTESEKMVSKRMYSELVIPRAVFYTSNHREFKCTDCHSEDYATFPHAGNLRMETKANCLDCHGGDEKYAKFKFEQIDAEFQASVHSEKHGEDFTCWMCHNAHTYKINARTNKDLKETITYDNMICLHCHADAGNYQILTSKQKPNILQKHEWLPNQASHFTNVRCIECHARNEDTLVVAHHIVPKNQAVRKCESCHSKNSILYASLYKFQVREKIQKEGIIKGILGGEITSIGPDNSNILNIISLVIFGLTMFAILIHAFLRIKNK